MFNLLSATPVFDAAEPVVTWLTVGLACAAVVAGIILFIAADRKVFGRYVKYAIIGATFYALIIGILMVVFNLVKRTDPGYMEENSLNADVIGYVLVPLLIAFAVALICGIVLFVLSRRADRQTFKRVACACVALIVAAVVCAAATIAVYYGAHIEGDGWYDEGEFDDGNSSVNQLALYLSAAGLAVAAVAAALFLGRNDKSELDSRCIALAGITVALSFALSYIKLFELPQGGSVTFASLLPVMLFAYAYGPKKGVLVCFLYGVMQAMQDTYIIHPAQFLLDYPIAFAMAGFAGVFANVKIMEKMPQLKFALGAVVAGALRYVAHVLSGVFAFSSSALDAGQEVWAYSLAYNSFVFVDILIVIAAGVLIFSSRAFNKQLAQFTGIKTKRAALPDEEAQPAEDAQ